MNPIFRTCASLGVLLVAPISALSLTLEEVQAQTLAPYAGRTERGVDVSTLTGKVMCGYQGWFNVEGDGGDRGWVHWVKGRGSMTDSNVKVDLWPDLMEYAADERFDTGLKHADGRTAQVFSSFKKPTVLRHFQWMREYGIDGAFVQRFANGLQDPRVLRHTNTVLAHCREGANTHGRAYAVMYDLSGLRAGKMQKVIDDWRALRSCMKMGEDAAYLHHRGKPLVAVWGIGFNDKRDYTLAECRTLIEFLKNDGCAVMLGIPTYWREQKNDTVTDPALNEVLKLADVLSPWTVGRYNTPKRAQHHVEKVATSDLAWCAEWNLDYLPVIFPGFSWHNMYGAPLDSIPRLKGAFYQAQIDANLVAGATMLYVAMFDEVDEGTAIFKCTNDVPVADGAAFLTYEGLPSDHYLKLTGEAAKRLVGKENSSQRR